MRKCGFGGLAYFFVGGVGFVAARAPAGLAGTAQGVFSATSGLAASQVLSTIGVLEMRRILRRLPGGRVERV